MGTSREAIIAGFRHDVVAGLTARFGAPQEDHAVVSSLGMSPDWPVIAILRKNVMVLMAPAAGVRDSKKGKPAKIKKVTDLAGRRVGILARTEASPDLLHFVLNHYGVPTDKVQVVNVEPQDLAAAIRDNWFDAMLVAGPATGKAMTAAIAAASSKKEGPTFV